MLFEFSRVKWSEWWKSNPRDLDPKSSACPLGYVPMMQSLRVALSFQGYEPSVLLLDEPA